MLLTAFVISGAALAIDIGAAYAHKEKCEFIMEAAALAAARHLPDSAAAGLAAAQIAEANGIDASAIVVQTPHAGDAFRVQVTYSGQQPSFFARALGVAIFPIASQSAAGLHAPAAFDYALFSASTTRRLDLNGITVDVTGHVHSNANLRVRGATVAATGRLEASGQCDISGSEVQASATLNGVNVMALPGFDTNTLRALCAVRYTGNQHWSGQTIDIDGGLFVDGDLKMSGVTVRGRGLLVVTGDIELAGTTFSYSSPSDQVCVYSLGDILITGETFRADGILYAPHGRFESHGSTLDVTGSIVANTVDFAGVTVTVVHQAAAPDVFPSGTTRLTR